MMSPQEWDDARAVIWRSGSGSFRLVRQRDPIQLKQLIGIEYHKEELLRNTRSFLEGKTANHAMLWGARGTGKSSLVKAVFNEFAESGLRLIQVDRDDLTDLSEIVDSIRDLPYRFIVFCDDLSFDESEKGYRQLKSVLEGSIELPPENVLLYITSNRRHLLPEHHSDNDGTHFENGEIHYGDAVEEKISLSDRFGLWLSFCSLTMNEYLDIVESLFHDYSGDREILLREARAFTVERGGRSGRTARQFYNHFKQGIAL